MYSKYNRWIVVGIVTLMSVFGMFWFCALVLGIVSFTLGLLTVLYLQHGDLDQFLDSGRLLENPLEERKILGLNLGLKDWIYVNCKNVNDQKPIMLISPNIKIQTESKKYKILSENRIKKSILDTGIELLFKKHMKSHNNTSNNNKDGGVVGGIGGASNIGLNSGNNNNNNHNEYHSNHSRVFKISKTDHLLHRGNIFRNDTTILDNKDDHGHNQHHQQHNNNTSGTHHLQHQQRHNSPHHYHSSNPQHYKFNGHSTTDGHRDHEKKWKPFETIKIYTDKKRSSHFYHDQSTSEKNGDISFGEECSSSFYYNTPNEMATGTGVSESYTEPSSPLSTSSNINESSNRSKTILSGNKQIDQLIHLIIDYTLRDFISSWYSIITDNKEFIDIRARNCIEEFVTNLCNRTKQTQWIPLITTKMINEVATHAKYYRIATQVIAEENREKYTEKNSSPQRKSRKNSAATPQHKRNKSDTEVNWFLSNPSVQKNVANSKFYANVQPNEQSFIDPEYKLLDAFFNNCDSFRDECMNEAALEKYLTDISETILYFSLPHEDFSCLPLRTFLCTLLANVIFKPILEMLSDPDFINLQTARIFSKDPPSGEYLIKMIRQCSDLQELRACRQLITREMELKHSHTHRSSSSYNAELASLKFTQKMIDLQITNLQNNISCVDFGFTEYELKNLNLPILTLDEILSKELALSYYLDYLNTYNLQKYVLFYIFAQEWKTTTIEVIGKSKVIKEDIMKMIRDKAKSLYAEYLMPTSTNSLKIDSGLIDTLSFKLKDASIIPETTWFDSICKFIYEKLKNEDIFLGKFYQSKLYKKLLLELELELDHPVLGPNVTESDIEMNLNNILIDLGSDTNSSDNQLDDDDDDEIGSGGGGIQFSTKIEPPSPPKSVSPSRIVVTRSSEKPSDIITSSYDFATIPFLNGNTLSKHSRSHSDCTGMGLGLSESHSTSKLMTIKAGMADSISSQGDTIDSPKHIDLVNYRGKSQPKIVETHHDIPLQKLSAKIINTAIHNEGQYAVYAIHVQLVEKNEHKSWHIYRRYSRFLELKKHLVKRFAQLSKIPFPAKKVMNNTDRSVLEYRMKILNEFLNEICLKAETNDDIFKICNDFVEPDTNDRRIHGGAVTRTIETIVNPLKSGIRTIRNMPDNFIGGLSKIFLGRSPMKEATFLVPNSIPLDQKSSEYPALTAALKLLDEVFDLQSRSQWLRRGIINRLLGAPWVSHTANKKIIQTAKSVIELDKIEAILTATLNTLWPDGKQQRTIPPREDNTKLRTRMAAKISLFALVADDLKHVVGSETTRSGLLNFFQMLQNKKLNLRLILILLNHVLKELYKTDDMLKHVKS